MSLDEIEIQTLENMLYRLERSALVYFDERELLEKIIEAAKQHKVQNS